MACSRQLGSLSLLVTVALLGAQMAVSGVVVADEADEEVPNSSLNRMQSLGQQTEVWLIAKDRSERKARFVPQAVFRYSDQPRSIHDATMWIWMDSDDRPVAVQKIEDSQHHATAQKRWTYCLASLSLEPIRVQWPEDRAFETQSPGLEFQLLPDAPPPAKSRQSRARQVRQLSRQFAATIINNPKTDDKLEMRLLPRPILEFGVEDTAGPMGAIFGFATSGTNPDLLLVIELQPDQKGKQVWQFATARMTTGGLVLRHAEEIVWSAEWIRPIPKPLENWTFFFVPKSDE